MTKAQALEILQRKLELKQDDEQWIELLSELMTTLDKMQDSDFSKCETFADIRETIQCFKPDKAKRSKPKTTTYVQLAAPIDDATEKAIAIVTGSNGMHGSNFRVYMTWIPTSQVIEEDGKTFIPSWLVAKNQIWNFVDRNSKITR